MSVLNFHIIYYLHNDNNIIGGNLMRERFAYLETNESYKFTFESGESTAQVYPGQVTMHATYSSLNAYIDIHPLASLLIRT